VLRGVSPRGALSLSLTCVSVSSTQGCIDQYALKYFASVLGWPIIAVPFLMKTDMPVAEVAARYRESDSLIQSASGAIGDLLMVYKKLQRLAGYTGRVVELLEAVDAPSHQPDEEESSGTNTNASRRD
jgi:ATP-binding cassette subfamily D (ALD) protein 3